MAGDVFVWQMSAEDSKSMIDMVREEILAAHQSQQPLPIAVLLALLPLDTDDGDAAIARGNFTFNGDAWENRAPESLEMTFHDPVLKDSSILFPADFTGKVDVQGTGVKLIFDPPLEIEIPRLAELGVDRSQFQTLWSLDAGPHQMLSILKEADGEHRETWIQVRLSGGAELEAGAFAAANSVSVFGSGDESGCANKDPNERNWYVYERVNTHMCYVHYGTLITGGQVAYKWRFGPATKAECDQYEKNNCGFE